MRQENINLTKMLEIPIENIKNIYVTGKYNVVRPCKIGGKLKQTEKKSYFPLVL